MTEVSRSLRRRDLRRRRQTVRFRPIGEPARVTQVQVHVELSDAKGIWQSFLIMPGTGATTTINGFMDSATGWKYVAVPIAIRARIV